MALTITSNSGAIRPSGTGDNPMTIDAGIIVNGGTGAYAVYADTTQPWTIVNFGTLTAAHGVYLNGSVRAVLTNSGTGAVISGSQDGVDLLKNAGTILNQGSILGGSRYGVWIKNTKGAVTNSGATALIQGGLDGIFGTSVGAVVLNQGTIRGVSADGVYLQAAGSVTNTAGALISGGGNYGVRITTGYGHVTNEGSIFGANAGVDFLAGGTLINDATTAVIQGSGWGAYFGAAGSAVTVTNQGTIAGTGAGGQGIHFGDGGVLTNSAGLITGSYDGVDIRNASGYVVNASTISGGAVGVFELAGGSLTNSSTGTISATYAVAIKGGTAQVTNAGDVNGSNHGVEVDNGGTVVNQAGATISAPHAVLMSGGVSRLDNSGVINGGSGTAVSLGAGFNNLLAVYPGASFTGTVDGGNTIGATAVSTLELASGASTGTLSGLGSQFVNFANVTIDSSADWQVNGTVVSGATLNNAGTIGAPVTLAAGAALTNASSGLIAIATASTNITAIDAIGAASVVNAGHIYGYGTGVILNGGGQLTNLANAVIDDSAYAAVAVHGGGVIINGGTLTRGLNSSLVGADLYDGSSLTNQSGGAITAATGVAGRSGQTTVVNAGSIATSYNPDGIGVTLSAGGRVTNLAGGFISGHIYGVKVAGAAGTVVNAGTIVDATVAVTLAAGYANRLIVDPGASFTGTVDGGNTIGATSVSTLELATGASTGTLSGLGSQFVNFANVTVDNSAIWLVNGSVAGDGTFANAGTLNAPLTLSALALLSNASSGTIAANGGAAAVYGAAGGAATVANAGTILGSGSGNQYGIKLHGGGIVTNASGGAILGDYGRAVEIDGGGTLINAGSVYASFGAIYLYGAGSVTNQSGGTISAHVSSILLMVAGATAVNDGLVSAGGSGVLLGPADSVTNQSHGSIVATYGVNATSGGSVVNQAGGLITGSADGVLISGGVGTVTNAGSIDGSTVAITLAAGYANRLIVDPGAVFAGKVDGGNTIGAASVSTLELASGASAGTLASLGAQFIDFARLALDGGAAWTLSSNSTLVAGQTLAFGGAGSYLHLNAPDAVAGHLTNFAAGDTIDLAGINPASVSYAAGTLSFTGGAFGLSLGGGGTLVTHASADGTALGVLCFCAGTMILTPSGERRVQDLAVGDLVTTANGAKRPIVWIGAGKVLATRGRRGAATPVIVRRNAIAPNVPCRDLRVTKGHSFYLDDVLIPAECLVNHRSIVWDDKAREVELYHVELEEHDVLIADGAPAESYRDVGHRWLFGNANPTWDVPPREPCAPILTGGPLVDAVWRRLLDRAGPRRGVPLTTDADLHLLVDGARLDASARRGDVLVFRLPRRPTSVRIVSRAATPDRLGTARDPRQLGVALRRIALTHGRTLVVVEPGDARLAAGFHAFEARDRIRWTDGDALLPIELFAGFGGPVQIELTVARTTQYELARKAA